MCRAEALRAEAAVAGRAPPNGADATRRRLPAWERAADAWAEAAAVWGALAAPHPRAYAHWRQAELLLEGRRRRQGLGTLQLAHDEAARIGARFLVERIAETHRHARGNVRVTESPKPAANPHGLTDRELDVLARMRDGKANKAIAHELFISERTVTTHVGHVLMKLDVKNRTEAARVADRPDLAALLEWSLEPEHQAAAVLRGDDVGRALDLGEVDVRGGELRPAVAPLVGDGDHGDALDDRDLSSRPSPTGSR